MDLLRKLLIRLRAEYEKDRNKTFLLTTGAVVVCAVVTGLIDQFFSFNGWWNVVRSVLLIPSSIAIFSLLYSIGLLLHFQRIENDPLWAPFRTRFSPAWRTRIALIIFALLFVMAQALSKGLGYTFSSSVLGAIVIVNIAFLRRSKEEASRESLGIPDSRDVLYDSRKRAHEREQELKAANKKKRRQELLRGEKRTPAIKKQKKKQ